MSSQLIQVKRTLDEVIQQMCDVSWMFSKDPQRDFTRKRKLPFCEMLSVLLSMEGGSLTSEMLRHFGCTPNVASSSAFIQQRGKLTAEALPSLFDMFVKKTDENRHYKGFRLLAADGSDIQIPTDAHHIDSYLPGANGQAPYNLLHLDAVYDLLRHTYTDATVTGKRCYSETGALCKMADRSEIENALLIADRGYESYNLMAHMQEKGWKYLIRIKDAHSRGGIASGLDLPCSEEFDSSFALSITTKQTKAVKLLLENKNRYKFLPSSSKFDYLPNGTSRHEAALFYTLSFRVVRFKITDDSYETMITNLDPFQFPPLELKALYAMRWGIETSFRELKYTLGLLHVHSKKAEYICQEIFAKLIMYNFSELITSTVIITKTQRKHPCKANFSVAVHICRQFFLGNVSPPDVEALIQRNLSPIRPGRSRPRKSSAKHAVSFTYRIA